MINALGFSVSILSGLGFALAAYLYAHPPTTETQLVYVDPPLTGGEG